MTKQPRKFVTFNKGRTCCCVPYCARTTTAKPNTAEWICSDHWRLVDHSVKRLRARIRRRYARRVKFPPGDSTLRVWRALWRKAKAQAIERSAGITG